MREWVALRCALRLRQGVGRRADFEVDTPIGIRQVRVGEDLVDAEIGPTLIEGQETIDGQVYRLVDTGNPR